MEPRASILLPTHNRPDVLGFAIQSVLWQTEKNFELLIVGDGCADDTRAVVASFNDPRIRWFDLPKAPLSGYANRNIALRQARGQYVAYTQDDDILLPDHVEKLIGAIETSAAEWAYSRPLWVTSDGFVLPYAVNLTNSDELDHFLNVSTQIPSTCVMHARGALDRVGYWPEDLPRVADWHCWRRMITTSAHAGVGYCRAATALHFRSRLKLRDSVESCRLREIARESWWPDACAVPIPAGVTEQKVFFEKLSTSPSDWINEMRIAVADISDRLAWAWTLPAAQTWPHEEYRALEKRWRSRSDLLRQLFRVTFRKFRQR